LGSISYIAAAGHTAHRRFVTFHLLNLSLVPSFPSWVVPLLYRNWRHCVKRDWIFSTPRISYTKTLTCSILSIRNVNVWGFSLNVLSDGFDSFSKN
jgi:hypothetical protein